MRFPGFSEGWEERKLKEVSERVRGNDGRMDLPTLTISAASGWLDQRERFSGNIAGNEQKNYTLLSKGELSYNHGNSKLAKYGAVFVLRTFEEALVPKIYHSFKMTEEASADFIESMFATKKPDKELAKLISSGARMDGLLNINYDEFVSINITIPQIEEQRKIAKFLRDLENAIILQQQELETLKQTKQGFLQKMLPKEGDSVPELRFSGFTDAWEQYKLKDVFSYKQGQQIPVENQYFENPGDLKRFIRIVDLTSINEPERYINYDGDNVVKTDDLFMIRYGQPGIVGYGYMGVIANNLFRLIPKIETVNLFYKYIFEFIYPQIKSLSSSTTMPALNFKSMDTLELTIPGIDEQQKIGNFFKQIDGLITLHQRELDALKETKKAFLQKMFV